MPMKRQKLDAYLLINALLIAVRQKCHLAFSCFGAAACERVDCRRLEIPFEV